MMLEQRTLQEEEREEAVSHGKVLGVASAKALRYLQETSMAGMRPDLGTDREMQQGHFWG